MLRKVQEEQAEIIGYIFERGNEEEESIALANGGHSSQGIPVSFNCDVRIVLVKHCPQIQYLDLFWAMRARAVVSYGSYQYLQQQITRRHARDTSLQGY